MVTLDLASHLHCPKALRGLSQNTLAPNTDLNAPFTRGVWPERSTMQTVRGTKGQSVCKWGVCYGWLERPQQSKRSVGWPGATEHRNWSDHTSQVFWASFVIVDSRRSLLPYQMQAYKYNEWQCVKNRFLLFILLEKTRICTHYIGPYVIQKQLNSIYCLNQVGL